MKQRIKLLLGLAAVLVVTACGRGMVGDDDAVVGGQSGDISNPLTTTGSSESAPAVTVATAAGSTSEPVTSESGDQTSGPASDPAGLSPTPTPTPTPIVVATGGELGLRLITRYVSVEDFDAWFCTGSGNQSYLYGFFNSNGYRQGLEVVVDSNISRGFDWSALSGNHATLEFTEAGTQVDLTNIQFSNEKTFTADNNLRGALACKLEAVQEDSSEGTGNSVAPTGNDAAVLTARIATSWTNDSAFDIWVCSTEAGGVGYIFTLAGEIAGQQVAIESSTQSGETVTIVSTWRATGVGVLEITQKNGVVVTIGNILFDGDQRFSGYNSKFGRMACKLESY